MTVSFSQESYYSIIRAALAANYNCTTFRDAFNTPEPVMILRHDVDFSLDLAVKMGKWEKELGVTSTYFVMVACEHYNVISATSRSKLLALKALGHEVGLHWDSSTYPEDSEGVQRSFMRELDILSDCLGETVRSASQHIPTDNPAYNVESFVENEAYSDVYKNRFSYVSDSSMRWREKTPYDLIEQGNDMQFLSHPIWWATPGENADDILRQLAIDIGKDQSRQVEEFITYMNKILDNRQKYDIAFREKRNW